MLTVDNSNNESTMKKLVTLILVVSSFSLNAQKTDSGLVTAMAKFENGAYNKAIEICDSLISIDSTNAKLYAIKGRALCGLGDKANGCQEVLKAIVYGDVESEDALKTCCKGVIPKGESLILYWPENENWQPKSNQENDQMKMVELLRNGETFDNWTEIGTMQSIKGAASVPLEKIMQLTFEQTKTTCPKAKLSLIERSEKGRPWLIFTIECPKFKDDKTTESQLWYITPGETTLYVNFRAIKKASIPDETKKKWTEFFKSGVVIKMD